VIHISSEEDMGSIRDEETKVNLSSQRLKNPCQAKNLQKSSFKETALLQIRVET